MEFICIGQQHWVIEDRFGLLKADAVFVMVYLRFADVPFEYKFHRCWHSMMKMDRVIMCKYNRNWRFSQSTGFSQTASARHLQPLPQDKRRLLQRDQGRRPRLLDNSAIGAAGQQAMMKTNI
jgi:hypothetical protein